VDDEDSDRWSESFVISDRNCDLHRFDGDISLWDVSKVESMARMFEGCAFNGDISGWDISNVWDMDSMFAESDFHQDISNWDVSNCRCHDMICGGCLDERNWPQGYNGE